MIENMLAVAIVVAIGIATFGYHKRSATYIRLAVLLGAMAVMVMTAITDPDRRWFGMLFTLLGATFSYRLYVNLKSEQPRSS